MSNTLSYAFLAIVPFESFEDCQEFVHKYSLYDYSEQCISVDTQGSRTTYEQEPKLAPDWSLRPLARPEKE